MFVTIIAVVAVLVNPVLDVGGSAIQAAASEIRAEVVPAPSPTAEPVPEPALTLIGSGFAAHYGVGVMERVAQNRGYAPQTCQISYTYATMADMGSWVYVESQIPFADGAHGMWCQIMDMPQAHDFDSISGRGIIVELGWQATPYLCGLSSVGQEPPRACPVMVYR